MQFVYLNQDTPQYIFSFYFFLGYCILQYQISFMYYNVIMVTHHTSFSMAFHCEIERPFQHFQRNTSFLRVVTKAFSVDSTYLDLSSVFD